MSYGAVGEWLSHQALNLETVGSNPTSVTRPSLSTTSAVEDVLRPRRLAV
jgi:hypothetical protein